MVADASEQKDGRCEASDRQKRGTFFSEENSVESVNSRIGPDVAPRLATVMSALVKHLHAFAVETKLTQDEWAIGIDFLTKTGQICSAERQEFILLSDVLGLSMLVDAINNRRPAPATENTVLGPFHVAGGPVRPMGYNISLDGKGEACLYEGKVTDLDGVPIEGASIDVWSDNSDGFYDVQQPGLQPKWNNRGTFITGSDGTYHFLGIKPVSYPIPDDGPVGKMLADLGRHPFRPAHIHYLVTAPGYQKLVTHLFVGDDPYIESDTVFGVKRSLVTAFESLSDNVAKWRSRFDFVLVSEED